MQKRALPILLALALAPALSACSLFSSPVNSAAGSDPKEADLPVDSRITSATRKESIDGLAVTWEVPTEPTDGFIIRYGTDPAALDTELAVTLADLTRQEDPIYGPVYRYVIENVPPGTTLFVAIAARRGDFVSDFTPTVAETRQAAREL